MMRTRLRDRPADDLAWCPPADQKPPNLDRCAIDACLDNPLSDSEWNLLEINGYIGEIREHRRTHNQAAVIVQQWRDAVGGAQSRRLRGASGAASLRWKAVSQLVAAEARRTQVVLEFRQIVLKGKTLLPNQIDRWLGALAQRQEAKPSVKVYASSAEIEKGAVELNKSTQVEYGYDTLAYVVPGSAGTHRILVSSKGILGYLLFLSKRLCEWYGWEECHATTFILTDVPPPIEEYDYLVDSRRRVPALTRVIMQVDPAMNPREVASLYREIRLKHFGQRHRSMSPKHIELAKFWGSVSESAPWKEVMQQWNQLHPDWAYKREQNFERDCTQARRRLLGQSPVVMNPGAITGPGEESE
jgi:hypothetical protein